jgi:rod shape-determining protein MreD
VRYYIGVPLVLLAAIVQTASLPLFSVFGAHPSLILIVLASWAVVRGQEEAMVLIPVAGLALGLLDSHPLGLHLLALVPLALLLLVHNLRLVQADLVVALAVVLVATLAYETVFLVVLRLTGESLDWWGSISRVAVPAAIANALLTPPFYGLVWLASVDRRRRTAL